MSTEKKEEVFIGGASGSRRFDKIKDAVDGADSRITDYVIEAVIDGVTRSDSLGEYAKQKFPNSRQRVIPKFDSGLGRYVIRREDGTEYTQEDVNQLVKDFPLTVGQRHWDKSKRGNPITKANLHDVDDLYLGNEAWGRTLEEGDDILNPNLQKEQVIEDMMRGNRAFMDESVDGARSAEVEFIIRKPSIGEEREEKKREEKELALEFYAGMKADPVRMRKILNMFHINPSETATASSLRNILFKIVDDNITQDRGLSYQKLFVKFSELSEEQLNLQSVVTLASDLKIIFDRAGSYEFDGVNLGGTYEGVLKFLGAPENSNILAALKVKVENTK